MSLFSMNRPQSMAKSLNSTALNWGPLSLQNLTGAPGHRIKNSRTASTTRRAVVFLFGKGMTSGQPLYWSAMMRKSRPLIIAKSECSCSNGRVIAWCWMNTVRFGQKKLAECNKKNLYDSVTGRMQH
jgi:hypothetical protein